MLGAVMRTEKENTSATVRSANHSVRREDRTQIPRQLKGRIKQSAESAFGNVPVHYNLDMPSRLDALAYTQEKQVEIGRGYQTNEISDGKRVAIIQRMRNNVVQRCESNQGGSDAVIVVKLYGDKYPQTRQHIEDAIAQGQPDILTLDRSRAKNNRRASLKGIDKVPGMDLDEYPLAMTKEGGQGASVRPISRADNRGSGSSIGHQLRSYPDGQRFRIKIIKEKGED